MYNVIYAEQVVRKDIPKLSAPIKKLIKSVIDKKLVTDPIKFGKPLRYNLKSCRSLRVGDYRVIYQITDKLIYMLIIQHRKASYKHT